MSKGFSAEALAGPIRDRRLQAMDDVTAAGLIIGESHDNPHGRGLAANLIAAGRVDDLFLEIADMPIATAFDSHPPAGGHATLGAWLNSLAGTDIRTNAHWARFKEEWSLALFRYDRHEQRPEGNPATMVRLIEMAVQRGVRVHLVDDECTLQGRGNQMAVRNRTMAQNITAATAGNPSRSRCLFLVGADHLASPQLTGLNMRVMKDLERPS
ncbi:hypothetical protein [Dyella agri]|uniref:Uncharacterized protein n=1 Tax=Dyella agri TaxID=1926869 RepID=A0ABW8KJU2_9GAMM